MTGKKRKLLIAVMLLGMITAGATLAFLSTATSRLMNTFTKGSITTELEEETDTDGTKIPRVKNTGENDCLVRIRLSVSPESAGEEITLEHLGADGKWQLKDDGFYYYQGILQPGKKTEPLFTKVIVPPTEGQSDPVEAWTAFLERYPDFTITVYQEACQTSMDHISAVKDGKYDQSLAEQVWKVFEDAKDM